MKPYLLTLFMVFSIILSSCTSNNSQAESPQVGSGNQSAQISCTEAGSYMGQMVTCTLPQAYCRTYGGYPYGEDGIRCTESEPNFTFMVVLKRTGDHDSHYYDGKCLILSGVVTSMHSAQTVDTVVTTLENDTVQVSSCQ